MFTSTLLYVLPFISLLHSASAQQVVGDRLVYPPNTPNFDFNIFKFQLSGPSNLSDPNSEVALLVSFADPYGTGSTCGQEFTWTLADNSNLTNRLFPCSQTVIDGDPLDVIIDSPPTGGWDRPSFNLTLTHIITFKDNNYVKRGPLSVPRDVGSAEWACRDSGGRSVCAVPSPDPEMATASSEQPRTFVIKAQDPVLLPPGVGVNGVPFGSP